jgi:hypothetical protein
MVDILKVVEPREAPWATYKLQWIYIEAIYVVPKTIERKKKNSIETKTMKCLFGAWNVCLFT